MTEKRIVIFQHGLRGHGEHNKVKDEMEFDIDATEEEINEAFQEWVWQEVGDHVTWYDKD